MSHSSVVRVRVTDRAGRGPTHTPGARRHHSSSGALVDKKDFRTLLRRLGVPPLQIAEGELMALFNSIDADRDGKISGRQFAATVARTDRRAGYARRQRLSAGPQPGRGKPAGALAQSLTELVQLQASWDSSSWTVYNGSSPCWWRPSPANFQPKRTSVSGGIPRALRKPAATTSEPDVGSIWDIGGTRGVAAEIQNDRNRRIRSVSRRHAEAADRRAAILKRGGVPPVPEAARRRAKVAAEHELDVDRSMSSPREVKHDDFNRMREPLVLLKLDRAVGLPVKDANGTSDPYAIVSLIDTAAEDAKSPTTMRRIARELKSRVVHRTTAPVWDELFAFRLRRKTMRTDVLQIDIYDADPDQDDEYMCSVCVPVSRLFLNSSQTNSSNWYKLSDWQPMCEAQHGERHSHDHDAATLQKMAVGNASVLVRWRKGLVMDERSVRNDVLAQYGSVIKCRCLVPLRKRSAVATFATPAQAIAAVRAHHVSSTSNVARSKGIEITFADCTAELDESSVTNDHPWGAMLVHAQAASSGPDVDADLRRLLLHTLNSQQSRGFACGRLTVQVVSATGLPKMDFIGLCDPFVTMKYGDRTARTEVIHHTTKPQWDAAFSFDVMDPEEQLVLTCMDWDDVVDEEVQADKEDGDQHDFIGSCTINVLQELAGRVASEGIFTLWALGPDLRTMLRGEITVLLDFEPNPDNSGGIPQWEHPAGSTDMGHVSLVVHKAFNIPHLGLTDANENDVKCSVRVLGSSNSDNNSLAATPVITSNNPAWHHECSLVIDDPACIIQLDVEDANVGNDFAGYIGGCRLAVADLLGTCDQETVSHWFRLHPRQKVESSAGTAEVVDNDMARKVSCPLGAILVEMKFSITKSEFKDVAAEHNSGQLYRPLCLTVTPPPSTHTTISKMRRRTKAKVLPAAAAASPSRFPPG